MTKKQIKRKIATQREYIKGLAAQEFSTTERRIEITNSAMQVLERLEKEYEEVKLKDSLEIFVSAAVLSAVVAIILFAGIAFITWSVDFGRDGFLAYRGVIAVSTLFIFWDAIKLWGENEDED